MQAITLKPDYAMAHCNLGALLQEQGKLDEALESYRQTIILKPDYAMAHNNLGAALHEQGKLDRAIVSYRQAITLKPVYVEAHNNLGTTLKEQGKLDEAIVSYRQAITLKPDYVEAHNNLGTTLKEQGKLDEAIANYRQAITLKPDYAEVHNNLGAALQEQGEFNKAIVSYRQAIMLKPDYTEAHNNFGATLHEQGKFNEAIEYYKQAIALKPDYAEAHNNLGNALLEHGKPDDSIIYYNRAIALKPDYAEAHVNKSFVLMLTENFEEGWSEYEWRLREKDHTSHTFQQPQWNGKPLNGKSILIHAEQGFGDTIQFIRYLPMVQAMGGHVIFECQKNLFRLLKSCAGIDEIIEQRPAHTPVVRFDTHVPLLSLPGIFGTSLDTIPSDIPYITADPGLVEQWRIRFGHNDAYKVGIVWTGNPLHNYVYYKRSCLLDDFAPLVEIPRLEFYSLQKGPGSVRANNPPKGMNIINLVDELNDFTDTAAIIANLDLVISIDTSVAHLAGAIGKPVWNLLSFVPDWRWFLNRDDSPWYPGMRLFRQTKPNNWTEVFEQMKKMLLNEIDTEKQISEAKRLERVSSV